MKKLVLLIFIQLPITCLSQRTFYEQKALDFYIENIHQSDENLYTTGKVSLLDDAPNYLGYIMAEYLVCKRRHEEDLEKKNYFYNEYMRLNKNLIGELDTVNLKELNINIEDPIRVSKKLKYKKLHGGIIGFFRKISSKIFGEPFNMHFSRYIKYEGFYYTMIAVNKKDSEYGREYWFRLSQDGEILDYCKSGWIQ